MTTHSVLRTCAHPFKDTFSENMHSKIQNSKHAYPRFKCAFMLPVRHDGWSRSINKGARYLVDILRPTETVPTANHSRGGKRRLDVIETVEMDDKVTAIVHGSKNKDSSKDMVCCEDDGY